MSPLDRPVYQLMLPLEDIEQAIIENEGLTKEEITARSEAALAAINAIRVKDPETNVMRSPEWMDLFKRLQDGGWYWRVALYIAWAAQPKKYRIPETQEELATKFLGLASDRVISTWRKRNPTIDSTIAMMQGSMIYDALPDAYAAMIKVATRDDYKSHQDRKLMFEMGGVYTPRITAELKRRGLTAKDVEEMTDEELEEIITAAKGREAEQ
jgi:hypothetical protein